MLVVDEAHTIFNLARFEQLLGSTVHPKVLFLLASGEGSASSLPRPLRSCKRSQIHLHGCYDVGQGEAKRSRVEL